MQLYFALLWLFSHNFNLPYKSQCDYISQLWLYFPKVQLYFWQLRLYVHIPMWIYLTTVTIFLVSATLSHNCDFFLVISTCHIYIAMWLYLTTVIIFLVSDYFSQLKLVSCNCNLTYISQCNYLTTVTISCKSNTNNDSIIKIFEMYLVHAICFDSITSSKTLCIVWNNKCCISSFSCQFNTSHVVIWTLTYSYLENQNWFPKGLWLSEVFKASGHETCKGRWISGPSEKCIKHDPTENTAQDDHWDPQLLFSII